MDRKDYKYIYNSLNKNGSDRNFNYPIYIRNKEVATQEWVSKTIEGGLEGLEGNYLTIAKAKEDYLSKVDAQNTYLTQVNAQNIYLSKNDANTTYLTNERAQSTYQRKGNYVELNSSNQIDSTYLPSYVDDVLEYNARNNFPSSGESGKIYVDTSTNLTYRWGGSEYVEISKSLALGETSSTAYAGDKGKENRTRIEQLESNKANKSDIPTKTSQLTNDSGFLTSHQDISGKANLNGGNTFSGLQTINAPTNVGGSEQVTVKIKTANGGAIVLGKEGPNSGTMIRLDQSDGTCRLRFRSSATTGAMVWEQPEKGAKLYIDLGKDGADKHRIQFPSSAGTLALKSQMPKVNNGTLTIQKNGTNVQTFTANQSGNVTANITVPTKVSELTNDSGFLTLHQDISGKADKADTLAGYGITNAYTKTETDNLINSKTKSVVFDTYDKFIEFLEDTSQATYDYFNMGDSIYIKEGGANYWISGKEDIVEGGYSYNRIISGRTGSDLLGTDNIYRKTVTVNIGTTYTSVEPYEVKPQSEAGYSNFSWNSSTGDVKITLESLRPNTEVTVTLKTYTPTSAGGDYGYYYISNIGPTKVSELTNDSGYLTTLAAANKYVDLTNAQTITGTKSFTSGLKVSGRVANSGDDEGIVVNTASNGYAGVCLGNNSGERSVFYFNNSHQAWWRYNNGTTSYDIHHPKKSGTIATTADIAASISTGTLSAKTALKAPSGYVYLVFVVGTNSYAKFGNSTSQMNYSVYHFMFIHGSLGGSSPIIARFLNNSTWSMITVGSTASFYFDREVQYIKFKIG